MDTPLTRILFVLSAIATMAYPGIHQEEIPTSSIELPTNIVVTYENGKLDEQTYTPTNTPTETPTLTPTEIPYKAQYSSYATQASYGNSGAQGTYYTCQCVWYVAGRRPDLPNLGNARDWLSNAQSLGFKTGYAPVQGAVVSLNESWWGHVGFIEQVEYGRFLISEMNVSGWCNKTYRWINNNDPKILGYIY